MNIAVPSRFACLNIDDDEPVVRKKPTEVKKKTAEASKIGHKDLKKVSNQKQVNGSAKKEKKVKHVKQDKQWDEWREKDNKLVDGNFEQDLESAILLSKLDYEQNKDRYDSKTESANKKVEKKKKQKTIPLNQFLSNSKQEKNKAADVQQKVVEHKENFFDRLQIDAQQELTKEQVLAQRREREFSIEEIITTAQYNEKLEVERKKNKELEAELLKAREEISNVKIRNQTLCTMLSTGEMKDKADVLLELERLSIVKNDLTEELERVNILLEQERSKVAALIGDNKYKDKKHKKHAQS